MLFASFKAILILLKLAKIKVCGRFGLYYNLDKYIYAINL